MIIKKKVTDKALTGKTIVNFGDSIFGNFSAPNDISTFIAQETGATVYNVGFGGCRMGGHLANWDAFSMYRLANAISTNDWSKQDAAIANESWEEPGYFTNTLNLLKSIDFNEVDIITISYGTNDFTGGNYIYDNTNLYGTYTYAGALMHSIETISEAFPNIEIVLCTPIYRVWRDGDGNIQYDSDDYELIGQKITDFVQATKDIATKYDLVCIDNYYGSGINRNSIDECFPSGDGAHPNATGRKKIAENMSKVLINNFA